MSEDAKFTKPKHRIIADAYAKRMDDVISVSYQNSYSDPAGINFDMNNLNVAESVTMGATLTNYLPNIINRRNAVTVADFKDQSSNYASSCADNNSEISVNVRQVSIESRRNSIDSQVSQVSFKVSETNIKATLNSQKHKGYKVKAKRRQRNILSSKRTNRRASSSSVESQRITNQMKQFKYKCPGFQVSANTVDRQFERRSACTTVDIDAMNQVRNHLNQIPLTSDEDQRNDKSQIMQIMDIDVFQQMDGVQSSLSDQSMNRVLTQSQTSKHSCDVGIQTNDYDISSHHQLRGDCDKDNFPEKQPFNYQQDDEYTGTHQLLPVRKPSSIVRRENLGSKHLSKSQRNELINELLLP